MRCVCTHWFDTAGRSISTLRPSAFPVLDVVEAFPSLKNVDLSNCTKVGFSSIHLCQLTCWHSALPKQLTTCHHDACIMGKNTLDLSLLHASW